MNQRFTNASLSYNHCRICGYQPRTKHDEPNRSPIRFWEPDDGWIIGTLCRWCADEYMDTQPHPDDYAYRDAELIASDIDTDEDPLIALE